MATPKAGYRVNDGHRVPSVTTIIGRFKDSGALIKWAYRQGREHELAAQTGGEDPGDLYAVTKKAADAGSVAHDLIEQHVLSGKVQTDLPEGWQDVHPNVAALAWNAYAQFQEWLDNTRIQIDSTEENLVSEKYRFGGTFDALGRDNQGRIILIDWKTSNAVYGDYLVQLAAYGQLIKENKGVEVEGYHLLRVRKETADFSHHFWADLSDAWRAFEIMRELYELMYAINKRA